MGLANGLLTIVDLPNGYSKYLLTDLPKLMVIGNGLLTVVDLPKLIVIANGLLTIVDL